MLQPALHPWEIGKGSPREDLRVASRERRSTRIDRLDGGPLGIEQRDEYRVGAARVRQRLHAAFDFLGYVARRYSLEVDGDFSAN